MTLIDKIRKIIPDCSISQDMIAGFPTETEEDHQDTLTLMEYVKYNFGYMYCLLRTTRNTWLLEKWKTMFRKKLKQEDYKK